MANRHYTLTLTAEQDFRKAKRWSTARWGKALTQGYFNDLHKAAVDIAKSPGSVSRNPHLVNVEGQSIEGVSIAAVREHYLVYIPVSKGYIIIVALLRQTQDVPAILEANSFIIQRDVEEVLAGYKQK